MINICKDFLSLIKVLKKNADIYYTVIGHVMRKLNGITINGEYLGNSVVINGMFRAICTISPVIMRDFVAIINKIDKLDDAVKIRNFNCGFDSIDIEFENSASKGIASLYFKLQNGEPQLTNCKLVIDNQEYSTLQDKISLTQNNNTSQMTNPNRPYGEESERQRRIRELREQQKRKLDELKRQKITKQKENVQDFKGNGLEHKSGALENKNQPFTQASEDKFKTSEKTIPDSNQHIPPEQQKTPKAADDPVNQLDSPQTEVNQEIKSVNPHDVETEAVQGLINGTDETNESNELSGTEYTTGMTETGEADAESQYSNDSTQYSAEQKDSDTNPNDINTEDLTKSIDNSSNVEASGMSEKSYSQQTKSQDDSYSDMSDEEFAALEAQLENEINNLSLDDESMSQNLPESAPEPNNYADSYMESSVSPYQEEPAFQGDLPQDSYMEQQASSYYDQQNSQYTDYSDPFMESLNQSYDNSDASQSLPQANSESNLREIYTDMARELNEGLSQGLIQGLSQGLSEGLSQGLSQGLSSLFGSDSPFSSSFNNNNSQSSQGRNHQGSDFDSGYDSDSGFDNGSGQGFDSKSTPNSNSKSSNSPLDFGMIDDYNKYAAMSAKDSYSFDENADLDALSDIYSDFYSESQHDQQSDNVEHSVQAQVEEGEEPMSEIDALKAELEALKAEETAPKKDLMTLDEFLEKQKELAEAKEKKRRQKFRIIGSREKINASALEDGVFVSGNKVYKWGDIRILDS